MIIKAVILIIIDIAIVLYLGRKLFKNYSNFIKEISWFMLPTWYVDFKTPNNDKGSLLSFAKLLIIVVVLGAVAALEKLLFY